MKEAFLYKKLDERKQQNAYRTLRVNTGKVDFCSNDYLGLAASAMFKSNEFENLRHGSTGSRLLSGNFALVEQTEKEIAGFHQTEAALIFNSGYDANLGLLSCIPQRGDTVLYDYLSHASIRDGIRLSFAEAFSFLHNDLNDLEKKLKIAKGNIFVVTESVFSMDGDKAPLKSISALCEKYGASLIVDEAHATGIIGNRGEGLVQQMELQEKCFARVHTFGKALAVHGAVVVGSQLLRDYLINFSRAFIYTTALPETTIASIRLSYNLFPSMSAERKHLQQLIAGFQKSDSGFEKLKSDTPIQGILAPGNEAIKKIAWQLQEANLDVRPIVYPTVPKGSERLRIVLHAFNSIDELQQLTSLLK